MFDIATYGAAEFENVEYGGLDADGRREYRARTETMFVVPEVDGEGRCIGMYRLFSQSGGEYRLAESGDGLRCDCPDDNMACKHVRRVHNLLEGTLLPSLFEDAGDYWAWLSDRTGLAYRERDALHEELHRLSDILARTTACVREERARVEDDHESEREPAQRAD